jgi:hypothetical protein
MRKAKPTRQPTREELRALAAEVIDERPFIRLDSPADRRRELDELEFDARLERLMPEVAAHDRLPAMIRKAMKELRLSQSELYARKLQP